MLFVLVLYIQKRFVHETLLPPQYVCVKLSIVNYNAFVFQRRGHNTAVISRKSVDPAVSGFMYLRIA